MPMATEAEAKEMWCPHAAVLGTLRKGDDNAIIAQGSQNRGYQMGGALDNCKCLGAKCMAWTWRGTHIKDPNNPNDTVWSQNTYGFCGLAAEPWEPRDRNGQYDDRLFRLEQTVRKMADALRPREAEGSDNG